MPSAFLEQRVYPHCQYRDQYCRRINPPHVRNYLPGEWRGQALGWMSEGGAASRRRMHVRWLQEQRHKPSTVSRRLLVVVCLYRTCVIDAILDHRRPRT